MPRPGGIAGIITDAAKRAEAKILERKHSTVYACARWIQDNDSQPAWLWIDSSDGQTEDLTTAQRWLPDKPTLEPPFFLVKLTRVETVEEVQ